MQLSYIKLFVTHHQAVKLKKLVRHIENLISLQIALKILAKNILSHNSRSHIYDPTLSHS